MEKLWGLCHVNEMSNRSQIRGNSRAFQNGTDMAHAETTNHS